MNAEINNLEHDIQLKEGLIKSLYQNREEFDSIKMKYDVKLKTLEHEVNKLKSERDKILKQMETQHELTEEQKVRVNSSTCFTNVNRSKFAKNMRKKCLDLMNKLGH